MDIIEYSAIGMSESEINREILHKILDELLTKVENGENVNSGRLERAYLNDKGEIKIKEYCLKILLGEREYGY